MFMKPLYIFDLDGTLSLTQHRQAILDNKDDPQLYTALSGLQWIDIENALAEAEGKWKHYQSHYLSLLLWDLYIYGGWDEKQWEKDNKV